MTAWYALFAVPKFQNVSSNGNRDERNITARGVDVTKQKSDIWYPFAASTRALTARASEGNVLHFAKSPQWSDLISHSKLISFEPHEPHYNFPLFYEIA